MGYIIIITIRCPEKHSALLGINYNNRGRGLRSSPVGASVPRYFGAYLHLLVTYSLTGYELGLLGTSARLSLIGDLTWRQ